MNILSLYDGMACGHIAMMLEDIPIDRYVAYEIDGYAVKTAVHRNDDGTYSKVDVPQPEDRGILLKDILEGGELVAKDKAYCLKHQAGNARDYFKKHHTDVKFEPVALNSTDEGDKARTLMAGYYKYGTATLITNKGFKGGTTAVAESVCPMGRDKSRTLTSGYVACSQRDRCMDIATSGFMGKQSVAEPVCVAQRGRYSDSGNRTVKGNGPIEQYYEARDDGKTNALTTVQKDNAVCEPVNVTVDGKSQTLKASPSSAVSSMFRRGTFGITGVAEPVRVGCMPSPDGEIRNSQAFRVYDVEGKSVNLTSGGGGAGGKTGLYAIQVDNREPRYYATPCEWDEDGRPIKAVSCADGKVYIVYEVKDGKITIKGKEYPIKLVDGFYIIRKLTVRECMRLQTVPEWYEFPVSDTQAYKLLGNGWTIETIRHLIRCAVKDGEKND